MIRTKPAVLALLAGALLVGGCVEPDAANKTTTTTPPAEAPTVSVSTGSIAGVVVDPELQPVPGVDVAILQTRARTTTDAAGAYTLNELEPGEVGLHFSLLGYGEATKKAIVQAGEVTYLNVSLQPLVIKETYQFTIPRSSFVKFGQWTVNHAQQSVNHSALNEQLCSDCWHVLVLEKGITAAQTEVVWVPSVNTPATNQKVGIGIAKTWGNGQLTSYFIIHDFTNRMKLIWGPEAITEVKAGAKIRINVQGPGIGSPGIVFQQKVDVYSTFAVGQDLDPAFSALPPP